MRGYLLRFGNSSRFYGDIFNSVTSAMARVNSIHSLSGDSYAPPGLPSELEGGRPIGSTCVHPHAALKTGSFEKMDARASVGF